MSVHLIYSVSTFQFDYAVLHSANLARLSYLLCRCLCPVYCSSFAVSFYHIVSPPLFHPVIRSFLCSNNAGVPIACLCIELVRVSLRVWLQPVCSRCPAPALPASCLVKRYLIWHSYHLLDAFFRAARFSLTLRLAAAIDCASRFVRT